MLKKTFWENKRVIFHSRDIRKCEKEFSVLFDLEKKKSFYEKVNTTIRTHQYTIIASAIKKDSYIQRFGRLSDRANEYDLFFTT